MNLRQMQVFQAVMECGSITEAAKMLNVSQPAVTTVLRHTEEQLKLTLFDRPKGRLIATPEAQILFKSVKEVFDRVAIVEREIEALRHSRVGLLKIIVIPVLGTMLLPSITGKFLIQNRMANISLQVRGRRHMMEQIASGAADLGFGHILPDDSALDREILNKAPVRCIMRRDHALAQRTSVSLHDIAEWPLVAINGFGLSPIMRGLFVEARLAPKIAIEVGLVQNAWAIVNEGVGIAIVDPFSGLERLFPDVVSIPIGDTFDVTLEVVYPRNRKLPKLARDFIDYFKAIA